MIPLIIPFKRVQSKKVEDFKQIADDVIAMQDALDRNEFTPRGHGKINIAVHHSQVAENPYNFFIIHRDVVKAEKNVLVVFVNPRIIEKDKETKTVSRQGCMSFPMKPDIAVPCYNRIKVYYETLVDGRLTSREEWIDGFIAEVFQHEVAHAHGRTIYDNDGTLEQKIENRRLKKQEAYEAKELRRNAPNNEPLKINISAARPVCKNCNIKPRAQASSRCTPCSEMFKKVKA